MRFELTIRRPDGIDGMAALLREYGLRSVNITDTSKEIDTVPSARRLIELLPDLDVMLHVACKHHSATSFVEKEKAASVAGVSKLLLVSGHPRGAFDSLEALSHVIPAKAGIQAYAVYNPYFTGDLLKVENARLAKKLAYPSTSGIALQIGQDRDAFFAAVKMIRQLRPDTEILGSLPIATGKLIERLRTKILHGVFLDHSFLFSVEHATRQVGEMAKWFASENVEPIVFAMDFDREVIEKALSLS